MLSFTVTYLCLVLCQGVVVMPAGAGGFIIGGVIIKRMSLTIVQQLRGLFILGVLGFFMMLLFCIQCDHAPLADVTLSQHAQPTDRLVLDQSTH